MRSKLITLSKTEREKLVNLHREMDHKKTADRIKAIILLDLGYERSEIEKILLIDRDTINKQVNKYKSGGVEKLIRDNYKPNVCRLSDEQLAELRASLNESLFITAQEVCVHVKKKYGISYRAESMVKLLHRIGFVYKKTKGEPAKADVEQQVEFVKKYKKIRKSLGKQEKIYFLDAMHPVHNSTPDYAWIEKGEERSIKTVSGRNRLNINGLYSPCDHETIIRSANSINAQSTLALLKEVSRKHPKLTRIYIIHDNARCNHARWLKERLPKKYTMVALPPYSPNLNLIERLWKMFRKDVMSNRYHASFLDFTKATKTYFRKMFTQKSRLKSLMAENFHIFDSA